MARPHHLLDARSFHRGAREKAFHRLVRSRVVLAPVLGAVALVFAFFEETPWRRVVLGVTLAILIAVSIEEFVRARRQGPSELSVPFNLSLMALTQLSVMVCSGGLYSPVVLGAVVFAFNGGVLLERRTILGIVLLLQVPAVWAMALVHAHGEPVPSLIPEIFGGAQPLERGPATWVFASVISGVLLVGAGLGMLVRSIFEDLFEEAVQERDRALQLHAEQTKALTALSAELAHELKNPLSSIKGLASLASKASEGKTKERLEVLRRETDRMQGILDELLTFTRPLVPLSREEVDLRALVADVALLHEASAAERGVSLRVRATSPVRVRCDPRKVRQVLVNLVANALDASPRGGAITLAVEDRQDVVHVRIVDEGPGIAPEIAGRLFEAGVTNKEKGSGIGLVVARSLARQHEGDVELVERAEGGCEARLVLPREAEAA